MSCAAIAYEPFGAKMPAPKASFNAYLQRIANKAVPSHCGRCVRPVLGSIYLWDTPPQREKYTNHYCLRYKLWDGGI